MDIKGRTRQVPLSANTICKRFRTLYLAGGRADPPTFERAGRMLGLPVIDPLVADRDRPSDHTEPGGPRHTAGETRLPGVPCGS